MTPEVKQKLIKLALGALGAAALAFVTYLISHGGDILKSAEVGIPIGALVAALTLR